MKTSRMWLKQSGTYWSPSLMGILINTIKSIFRLSLPFFHRHFGIEGVNKILLLSDKNFNPGIMRRFGARIGNDAIVHSPLIIHNAEKDYSNLTIGERCHTGKDVFLDLKESIRIADKVTISMRASIITHVDFGKSPLSQTFYLSEQKGVVIHSGAYIGAGAIILQGVTIGENAVIGAGAVVTENIPPYSVAVGVPARVVRKIKPRAYGEWKTPVHSKK